MNGARILGILNQSGFRSFSCIGLFSNNTGTTLANIGSIRVLLSSVRTFGKIHIQPNGALLYVSRVRRVPSLLALLGTLRRRVPSLRITMTNSCLNVTRRRSLSFPINDIASVSVCPVAFIRFLRTINSKIVTRHVQGRHVRALKKFTRHLRQEIHRCYFINNVPRIIRAFMRSNCRRTHTIRGRLLSGCSVSFSGRPEANISDRGVHLIFSSVPSRLTHRGRGFVFNRVTHNTQSTRCRSTVRRVISSNLTLQICHIRGPTTPLPSCHSSSTFGLCLRSIKLLTTTLSLAPTDIILNSSKLARFHNTLARRCIYRRLITTNVAPVC